VKIPGQLDVTRVIGKRHNSLELFVMSLCPFGQKAEKSLFAFLASTNASPNLHLDVHYIFYSQQKDGKQVFTSLHGEEEVMEDLVQMTLRDHYPALFRPYLELRTSSGGASWEKLLEQLTSDPLKAEIEKLIANHREQMILSEYSYAVGRYDITDGSPSYVWEGERVKDLRALEEFMGLSGATPEECSH
jgi:hypothetical protein